jgi:hypothetical protein
MAYWGKGVSKSGGSLEKRSVVPSQDKTGGLPTQATVRGLIKNLMPNPNENEFYELEQAEVISVLLDEKELPELEDGSGKNWGKLGTAVVRRINSEKNSPIKSLGSVRPLDPDEHRYPIRGESVVVVKYGKEYYYINRINLYGSPNSNVSPGISGKRPTEIEEEDYIYEHFEIDDEIRRIWPYHGDNIYQGRWGQSIRFGSNIIPDAHEDGDNKPDSPNILIRAGQLVDADAFGKSGVVQNLKESPKKPVKEDINADGSSVWITTDQSIKLDIKGSNAFNHVFMTSKQSDDQPRKGGKQIVLNSDRITFNTKQGKILGFSHDGIGFSTQKSFTVDADETLDMNVGGGSGGPGSLISMTGTDLLMQSPTNAALSISDKTILSSPCPSVLTLADYANITACKGAQLHLDDCAGIKDNQDSFLRVGGKALGITGYVKDRDDMGQQHLVYGEALTDILDELITSILNITAIPTGAGPSGPISATPSLADFESVRAKLCDLLMKPE